MQAIMFLGEKRGEGKLSAAALKFSASLFVCKQDGLVFFETGAWSW